MPTLRSKRALHALLLTAAALLLALHFIHLRADFPNHSRWMDWSKYTDEGWYGDAAIRHFQRGHWYVEGDFNPAAALPVWPFTEALVFAASGVSLTAARALTVSVFGGILLASWLLLAHRRRASPASFAPSVAVLLLAASPFCFVFTRMAILEPMLVFLTLLALLAAARPIAYPPSRIPQSSRLTRELHLFLHTASANALTICLLGLLLPALILTKTTALFLTPAIFWMLFASSGYRIVAYVRVALPAALLGISLWLVYFFALVRPHLLLDYRYLFSANAYTGMTRQNFLAVLAGTLKDGRWIGHTVYPLALAAAVIAVWNFRRLLAHPLILALILWSAGYMAFLAYHNNLQPRYYLVVAVPLTLLLPAVVEDLILPHLTIPLMRRAALAVAALGLAAIVLPDTFETIRYVRHPEYTLVEAAENVAAYIRQDLRTDPAHNPLLLSISGSDISLITGLPSICDDFGTLELVDRIKKYKPGWYLAWNRIEDDKMDSMSPQYMLERVAAWPAMDDPDRNLLVLYKLYPAESAPVRHPRGTVAPRRLRTRVGQQPSASQLVH